MLSTRGTSANSSPSSSAEAIAKQTPSASNVKIHVAKPPRAAPVGPERNEPLQMRGGIVPFLAGAFYELRPPAAAVEIGPAFGRVNDDLHSRGPPPGFGLLSWAARRPAGELLLEPVLEAPHKLSSGAVGPSRKLLQ